MPPFQSGENIVWEVDQNRDLILIFKNIATPPGIPQASDKLQRVPLGENLTSVVFEQVTVPYGPYDHIEVRWNPETTLFFVYIADRIKAGL